MAYQPLYATITDTNATRQTTSLRHRVNWIRGWINSQLGEVAKWFVEAQEEDIKGPRGGLKGRRVKTVYFRLEIPLNRAEISMEGDKVLSVIIRKGPD